jgi:hypothetical protein
MNNASDRVDLRRRQLLQAAGSLLAASPLPLAWSQVATGGPVPITEATSVEAYNTEQWRRSWMELFLGMHQEDRDICVLRQIQSAQANLKRPMISEEEYFKRMGDKRGSVNLVKGFLAAGFEPLTAQDGYLNAMIDDHSKPLDDFSSSKRNWMQEANLDALSPAQLVEVGVNRGHVVVMSVDMLTLHKAFVRRYFPEKASTYPYKEASHAVRVIGLQKKYRNTITEAFIYDSSCPNRSTVRYAIGFDELMAAYSAQKWNRSMFITMAKAFPTLTETY